MDVVAIRAGLAAACSTVTKLTGLATIPEKITANTAVVNPDDTHSRGTDQFITYNDALVGGLTTLHFEVVLLVPLASGFKRAQNVLDGYLSAGTGQATSVVDALNDVNQPGGTAIAGADHVLVEAARKYGNVTAAGTECATAALVVTVRAPRS